MEYLLAIVFIGFCIADAYLYGKAWSPSVSRNIFYKLPGGGIVAYLKLRPK